MCPINFEHVIQQHVELKPAHETTKHQLITKAGFIIYHSYIHVRI